jgi:hypothetical protein
VSLLFDSSETLTDTVYVKKARANTTRGLDFEHMIKARAHKEDMRIGKTPKKLDSICCP